MFAEKLKKVMAEKHITQTELAALSGLTKASISQYVNDRHVPNPRAVSAIAEALNVPKRYFTDDEAENIPIKTELPMQITPAQAAKLMGVCPQMIRINLQRGKLPFGYAMKGTGNRYSYSINTRLFMRCVGVTEQEVLEVV